MAELDRRLEQFAADIEREQRQSADADVALKRLDDEDATLKDEIKARVEQRSGVDERASEAETTLAAAERTFAELTTALADLTARRNAFEQSIRSQRERIARIDQEIAQVDSEAAKLNAATGGHGDLGALAAATEKAQTALADAEQAARASEAAHIAARQALEAARSPLSEADRRVQRLETEARTISKLLHGETKNMWPPVIDGVQVGKGYEKALGAALGDDLDAPVDVSAPMHWTVADGSGDPSLPAGAEALSQHVQAPAELSRRLAQIGVVDRAKGAELAKQLKTGQRLVSHEGDLWRWDGFVAAAHAPTGAARRLAERARLTEIEADMERARVEASERRNELDAAEAALKTAAIAETAARDQWRTQQREADAARERHAVAEREIGRHAARLSALAEGAARLKADRGETDLALTTAHRRAGGIAVLAGYRNQTRRRARRDRRAIARPPRKCAPKRRRWRAKPNSPTAACRRSAPSAANGSSARAARPRRSRPSKPASRKRRPNAPNWKKHRSRSPRSAAR